MDNTETEIEKNKQPEETAVQPRARYTKGEEIFNAVTHIVGGAFGVVALILGVIFAALYSDGFGLASMIIYGLCLVLAYTASSLYHFLRPNRAKKIFRIFDHCTIFLLIAGTYTPFCLVTLREAGAWGWTLFGVLWGLAIIGIVLKSLFMQKKAVKIISMILFLGMGWCAVVAFKPLLEVLASAGFWLVVAGGIVYTVGAILYVCGKKVRYIHSVWHLFVLAGSVLQFFAILLYVIK